MPPFVLDRTIEVRLIWQLSSVDTAVNVLHYDAGPATIIAQSDADGVASAVGAAFTSSLWRGDVADLWRLDRVGVRDLRTANLPEFESSVALAGTNAGQPLPAQTTLVATLRTAKAGRSFRGRFYSCGWSENSSATGLNASGSARDHMVDFLEAISLLTIDGQEWALAVLSRAVPQLNPVTSISANVEWDTQRRRVRAGI